jgi:magnesium-transporting ATPase (P-type)
MLTCFFFFFFFFFARDLTVFSCSSLCFSAIFERFSKDNEKACLARTKCHINEYSEAGLWTLALAYRELTEEEYAAWSIEYSAAKNSVRTDHDAAVEKASENIEKDLILLGATAVEDRLQKGVHLFQPCTSNFIEESYSLFVFHF